jgi:hypothetical protein
MLSLVYVQLQDEKTYKSALFHNIYCVQLSDNSVKWIWDAQWLRAALSKQQNRVGVLPLTPGR